MLTGRRYGVPAAEAFPGRMDSQRKLGRPGYAECGTDSCLGSQTAAEWIPAAVRWTDWPAV